MQRPRAHRHLRVEQWATRLSSALEHCGTRLLQGWSGWGFLQSGGWKPLLSGLHACRRAYGAPRLDDRVPLEMPAVRSSPYFVVRLVFLLGVLAIVLLYAYRDAWERRARLRWDRTLAVAVVLVRAGEVDSGAVDALAARLPDLEAQLASELRSYRPDAVEPFDFSLYGPLDGDLPPALSSNREASLWDVVTHTWSSWRYRARVNRAVMLPSRGYDSCLYLTVVPPAGTMMRSVEGFGQQGGHSGYVVVELDEGMVDFALFVLAHELFHTLGANDRYDSAGRTVVPEGLADPEQRPLYPQLQADVMGRGLLVSQSEERHPESLEELGVGLVTAREVRWTE